MILLDANVLMHGYAMGSTDNDFKRFAGLKCVNPIK